MFSILGNVILTLDQDLLLPKWNKEMPPTLYLPHLPSLGCPQRTPKISVENSYACETVSSLWHLSVNEFALDTREEETPPSALDLTPL